ncbi:TonB-dependent receptor [Maribellus maritimus]|uniref:TonB-dependent receptor n=1 Tax=Maribellus maritimus TaxID=2870838 RepID=UPI001EEC42F2|nr:TonB-dependent receptor [Maribellus maritimus]MCG6190143.1 TonB-dependent receptor [Maribellus maritimus]
MKKNSDLFESSWVLKLKKIILVMKLTSLFFMISIAGVFASKTYSQTQTLSLDMEKSTVKEVLSVIEEQSDFYFMYSGKFIDVNREVSINVKNQKIETLLNILFAGTDTNYEIRDKFIVLSSSKLSEEESQSKAQQKTVTGKVTDSGGQPLPGVTVVLTGTTKGTVTGASGEFSLTGVPDDGILKFSFVGMKSQEVAVSGLSSINITMEEDAIGIEEVVAVGYGTQKKRDVIGSIASIKSEDIETISGVSNFTSLLQGQAAGASVQTSSGRLGSSVSVKVRGLSSISAGTSPLWIIDGVPIITSASTGADYTSEQSPMSLINQADIESIEILKDAAATSIYGSRGSNGVIIITTKTGKAGQSSINIDYSTGISDLPLQKVDFVNTTQWFEIRDEAKQSYGLGNYTMDDFYGGSGYATEKLTRNQAETTNIDWFKEAMQKGSFHSVNLSFVGGAEKVSYFISSNYRKDKGVMLNDDLERYGLRANVDLHPHENFKTGAKLNFSLSNSNRGKNFYDASSGNNSGRAGGFSFLNVSAATFNPVYSLENPNEYFNPYLGNPVALSDRDNIVQDVEMYRALANIYGEYSLPFLRELALRSEISVDFVQVNRNTWLSEKVRWDGSWAQDVANTIRTYNYNLFLKYDKTIGDHSFNAVGGAEAQRSRTWGRKMEGQDLVGSYKQLGTPSQMITMSSGLYGESYLLAYFGRANYKYKDKYLAGISLRRDGSSVFTSEYRWGTFVALSAGWIISDEEFMGAFGENNFLKIRGSFGQTGNANIPSGLDASKYGTGYAYGSVDLIATNGTLISSIGVSNLTWETTNNFDIGVDFGFLNNRVNGSLAYYNKYVEDLLLATELPYSSGISSIYGNIGDLVNSGVELNFTSMNIESQNFKWQTSFNISFNHNEVKKLVPRVDETGAGMVSGAYITKTGYPVREYYLAEFAGVDPETGISMIYALDTEHYDETGETQRLKDESGNDVKIINSNANANANKFHLKGKNQIPAFYGGLTNKFMYKAFDLGFLLTFSGGNYIFDEFMRNMATDYSGTRRMLQEVYDNYWKSPGDNAKYQRVNWQGNVVLNDGSVVGLGDPRTNTDQFLFKGDYLKLKSVTLGYTLPESSKAGRLFKGLRVYTTFENLLTLTKYPGWDPEGLGTVGQWDIPQLFTATFGVSVKF